MKISEIFIFAPQRLDVNVLVFTHDLYYSRHFRFLCDAGTSLRWLKPDTSGNGFEDFPESPFRVFLDK